jgi:hypothetical protein
VRGFLDALVPNIDMAKADLLYARSNSTGPRNWPPPGSLRASISKGDCHRTGAQNSKEGAHVGAQHSTHPQRKLLPAACFFDDLRPRDSRGIDHMSLNATRRRPGFREDNSGNSQNPTQT